MSPQTRNRLVSIGVLIAVVAAAWIFLVPSRGGGGEAGEKRPAAPGPADSREQEPAGDEALPLTVLSDAPFAQEFGKGDTTPERELELLQLAFGDYLSFIKERYRKPFGYHEELISLLVGENPLRVAPIPPGHPRIDPQGRLTDRWGTPFDIHPLSSTEIEIRSAGPDRQLRTADDLHHVSLGGQDILDAMLPVAGSGTGLRGSTGTAGGDGDVEGGAR